MLRHKSVQYDGMEQSNFITICRRIKDILNSKIHKTKFLKILHDCEISFQHKSLIPIKFPQPRGQFSKITRQKIVLNSFTFHNVSF